MFKLVLTILGSLVLETDAVPKDGEKVCRALAMQGGGTRGAYEAGALHGLYYGKPNPGEDFDYDVVTGVSAGAVNTLGLGVFAKNDTVNAIEAMSQTWQGLSQSDLFSNWFPYSIFGMIRGLFCKTGVLNTDPFVNYAKKYYEKAGGQILRRVNVASADANTGNYHMWNETEKDFSRAAVSSSSIQFVFPPQKWDDGTIAMDGGVIWGINIATAIHRCMEVVDDESQIIVDILMCSARGELEKRTDLGSTQSNYLRFQEIQKFNDGKNDVIAAKQSFPDVHFRYYVEPTATIPGGLDLINPDNSTVTWPMQAQGRLDGAAVRNKPEGYYFEKMVEWDESHELQKRFRTVGDYISYIIKEEKKQVENVEIKEEKPKEENLVFLQ